MDSLIGQDAPIKVYSYPVFKLPPLKKHPNADSLSLVEIPETSYIYVARTEEWADWVGKPVCWIEPDGLVDTKREEFSFLIEDGKFDENSRKGGSYARIKARKLRGIISYGLLVKLPENFEGTDGGEYLGVKHFEPPADDAKAPNKKGFSLSGGETGNAPSGPYSEYDVEKFLKYKNILIDGELVYCLEKIDGENSRFLYQNGEYFCGSHYNWKREWSTPPNEEKIIKQATDYFSNQLKLDPETTSERIEEIREKLAKWKPSNSKWWKCLRENPNLEKFLRDNEGVAVYGELYGSTKLKYGVPPGEQRLAIFDLRKPDGSWMNYPEAREISKDLNWVPLVYEGPYSFEKILEMAEGNTLLGASHIREGIVIRVPVERYHYICGRVQFKVINPAYYNK